MLVSESPTDLQIKLIDFGFAQKFKKEEGMHLILGSPLYMAPELVKKEVYNESIDVWAVGIITYLLLCGLTPFQAHTIQDIHQNVLSKQIIFEGPIWANISDDAKNFIMKCLDRDPKSRNSINWLQLNDPWLQGSVI
jgi:serine/threonine protein kinase